MGKQQWYNAMRELGIEEDSELPPISAFVEISSASTPSKKARGGKDLYSRRSGKSSERDQHSNISSSSYVSPSKLSCVNGELCLLNKKKSASEDRHVGDTSSSDA